MSTGEVSGEGVDLAGLATAAAAGDDAAFAALAQVLEPVARRSARRAARTHPQLDVDEAVNLALARVWRGLGTYDPGRELIPWAAVVIAHAVRTAARTCRSARATMNWGAMLAPPAGDEGQAPAPIEQVAAEDTADAPVLVEHEEDLVAALLHELLSDREARALRMRLAGWTYTEIADALDVNLKAVDNALRRAGEKMRQAFGTEEELRAMLHQIPR